jgi:uncharacterized cysteine cluster protein YcgN (CxxCxxCC family)
MKEFWKNKNLNEFTDEEWELLCDRCGQCCLLKFEEDDGNIKYSNIVCKYLDLDSCNCNEYGNRSIVVPDCVKLTPERTIEFDWLPDTCAYKIIANKQPLPDWHPLIYGSTELMEENGICVRSFAISENEFDDIDIEEYLDDLL